MWSLHKVMLNANYLAFAYEIATIYSRRVGLIAVREVLCCLASMLFSIWPSLLCIITSLTKVAREKSLQ